MENRDQHSRRAAAGDSRGRSSSSRSTSADYRRRAGSAYGRAVQESKTSTRSRSRDTGTRREMDARRETASSRRASRPAGSAGGSARSSRTSGDAARRDRGTEAAEFNRTKPLIIAVAVVVVAAVVGFLLVGPFGPKPSGDTIGSGTEILGADGATVDTADVSDELPTPIMAQSAGVKLHCAVAASDLTEILIHNASYSYANAITTRLTEATNTEVMDKHGTGRVAADQPTGNEWMTGEFIRCFRGNNAGPRMSAIDCGAAPGSQVYSPVSGKVLLVKAYKLYEKYDDYQIHIQPDDNEDADVVLIHLTDPTVQAGDTVEAGVTPIAKIRDVYQYIGEEMQLKPYTAADDNGNHTHIQVNNAKAKDYHGLDDLKTSSTSSSESSSAADASANAVSS